MSFFSWLTGDNKGHSDESALVAEYAGLFESCGIVEARLKAIEFVQKAKEEVLRRTPSGEWAYTPDVILHSSDPRIVAFRECRRRDGVRDEDIRWWWNLTPLDRVLLEKADEIVRFSAFWELTKRGIPPDEASRRVFKVQPKFGDPAQGQGEDRPIAIELKQRIVTYIERGSATPDVMKRKYDEASSFNALIRAEIRSGTL